MNLSRRDFLATSAALGALTALPRAQQNAASSAAGETPRVLILGGTGFIGPHIVDSCKAKGWEVTLFNRGKTRPKLFDGDDAVEILHGDRDGDLKSLEEAVKAGRRWQAVVDDCGYVPRVVRATAELLAPAVDQYIFVSSISCYAGTADEGQDESAPLAAMPDGVVADDIAGSDRDKVLQYYGPLKAACEKAAEAACPGRTTIVRPGLIVGPGDSSDRYTYWPVRLARGGEVLAPGDGSDPLQYIDARDLADFIAAVIAGKSFGPFNVIGPAQRLTTKELLAACDTAAAAEVKDRPKTSFTWVTPEFLEAQGISAWQDLPVWVPHSGEYAGMHTMKNERGLAQGLKFRDPVTTARDTLVYWNSLPEDRRAQPRAGLSAEREAAALTAWHAQEAGEKKPG
ncbi:MAG TPA: NAD-dependent epimerase/dehydratase family protein [Planctomycetota bacterium]|nr:NAD-dependent epimerase/dehydratase family protein [Planctomycetota bacterium]